MPAQSVITESDSARINLRVSPATKALIEHAASLMGSTVSGFMLQNAYEAASRVVANHSAQNTTILLTQDAFDAFLGVCENPPEPTDALRKLMALR